MAKQFGVGDEALAGLGDLESFPFPADQRAALRFAEAMTRDGGEVGDELFEELRRHFGQPQIVEIATVIGLFNYFNRFNNALRMEITLTDPERLAGRVEQAIASAPGAEAICERVAEILEQGRRYLRVGIFEREGDLAVRRAFRGPAAPGRHFRLGEGNVGTALRTGLTNVVDDVSADPTCEARFAATRSELIVPIRRGAEVVGVIDVESDRVAAFGDEDRSLVERVASLLAPCLARR